MKFSDFTKHLLNNDNSGEGFDEEFEHHVGMKPEEFINHHRIEASKLILTNEEFKDISIRTIASKIGYEDVYTYISIFVQKEGMAPSVWRKKQLEKKD